MSLLADYERSKKLGARSYIVKHKQLWSNTIGQITLHAGLLAPQEVSHDILGGT